MRLIKKRRFSTTRPNILPAKERYKHIYYGKADYITIEALAKQKGIPVTSNAHVMVENYLHCQEAGHDKAIYKLQGE